MAGWPLSIQRFHQRLLKTPRRLEIAYAEHRATFAAIRAGEAERAEAELRTALELADAAGSALIEAESARELAVLFQSQGRNQDAMNLLNTARRLFGRVDARADLVNVSGKVAELGTHHELVAAGGRYARLFEIQAAGYR